MMERIARASPRFMARMAGALYVFSVLTAVFFELFLHGRMGYAANLITDIGHGRHDAALLFHSLRRSTGASHCLQCSLTLSD